jgi:hippurate hydrolase
MVPEAGTVSASSDKFDVVIQGKGGHGAMPNFGVDPLNVACHTHLALQEIIAREVPATDPAVVTVGYLQGGQANNVIPDSAKLGGTVRTFSVANRDFIEKRLPEIVKNVATTFRASASVSYARGCPSVLMDKALRNDFIEIINRRFGPDAFAKGIPFDKMMGSEDFSFVTEKVPSIMVALTAGDARKGMTFTQHHPKILFDEEVLYRGTAAYAAFAFDWLASHGV